MKPLHSSQKRSAIRTVIPADVDLTPIMSLFIILVPLLLVAAVFEQLAALKVHLPAASTIVEDDQPIKQATGIVELRLLITDKGLGVRATLSHDDSGKEMETYKDIQYEIPIKDDQYDVEKMQRILIDLKRQYPRHEDIVFIIDDIVAYDVIVQVMDACKEEIFLEAGQRKEKLLFPAIALSDAFSEAAGFEGLRKGTQEIDKKLGIQ